MKRLRIAALFALLAATSAGVAAPADPAANRRTAERVFLEKMGQGRFDRLDEIYAPNFVAHAPSGDVDLAGDNASGREWRRAFPDLRVTVARTAVDADLVAVHWHAAGTNTVAAAGLPGSGGRMAIEGMTFFRFADGRIAEEWSVIDIATMLEQLGAGVPAP